MLRLFSCFDPHVAMLPCCTISSVPLLQNSLRKRPSKTAKNCASWESLPESPSLEKRQLGQNQSGSLAKNQRPKQKKPLVKQRLVSHQCFFPSRSSWQGMVKLVACRQHVLYIEASLLICLRHRGQPTDMS